MATVTLIQLLASGVVDSTGAPIASGKVRAYQPGTLTPETIYADNAGATPIVQPLTLTAGGTGIAYFSNPIRLILKDSTDTSTLLDVNIVGGSPASTFVTSTSFNGGAQTTLQAILDNVDDSFGGTDWKYKQSATATSRFIKTWMSEVQVSVADYGAVGDDSTNNLTAIQNAINAVSAFGVLYFPAGTYRYTGDLTLPAGGITIAGAGRTATILKQMSTTNHGFVVTPTAGVTSNTAAYTVFRDLHLKCGTTSTGDAIRSVLNGTDLTSIRMRGVKIFGGWTRAVFNSTALGEVVCDDCLLSAASGDGVVTANFTATSSTVTSTTAKGFVGSQLFSSGLLLSGATAAADVTTGLYAATSQLAGPLLISSAVTPALTSSSTLSSAVTDSRTGSPVAFNLAGTNSVTPLPGQSPITKIVQSGAAATTTINAPAAAIFGTHHTIICSNTSGGALTWTFNAVFKTSAAVAPATGNRITLVFYYDAVNATWSEVTRSAAVPN